MSTSDFVPFAPLKSVYDHLDLGRLEALIRLGLQWMIGPRADAFHPDFRTLIRSVLKEQGLRLRCSSMRAVIEGRMGNPMPLRTIPIACRSRLDQVLAACDFIETVVCLHLEKRIKATSTDLQADIVRVNDLLGTSKLPGLMEALFGLESSGEVPKGGTVTKGKKR